MQHSQKRFITPKNWYLDWLNQPYFSHLSAQFDWHGVTEFPDVQRLNQWVKERKIEGIKFVCDEALNDDSGSSEIEGLYYEEIIAKTGSVPTRKHNWHDLFNATIWMMFPKTKRLLNQIHIREIAQHGLNPRTATRNRVTHFDECGGVLVYHDQAHLQQLQNHCWHEAFVANKEAWQQDTQFFIFGHANYEMLLNPYLGLTAKYFAIAADRDFVTWDLTEQYRWIDAQLITLIEAQNVFCQKQKMKPLPILGIPGWDPQNANPAYYQNTDYFRPLRGPTK